MVRRHFKLYLAFAFPVNAIDHSTLALELDRIASDREPLMS